MSPALIARLVKWVGYPLFGLFSFVVFLYVTFPYDKLKDRIEQQLSASGEMKVTIDELGPSPLFGLSAKRVLLVMTPKARSAPPPGVPGAAKPEKPKPVRILLDEVSGSVGLLAVLGGGTAVSFDVEGMGGTISGSYEAHKTKGWALSLEAERLRLADLPAVQEFVGLPVKGALTAKIDLTVPKNQWPEASGELSLECDGCAVGDGKAKLKVPGNPLLAMGITLPRIRLGQFGGQVKIEKGTATLENVSAKSPDIEVALEGTIALRQPLAFSNSQAYLKFKISPELKRRDPKFELVENGLGQAKRPDGFFGMRLVGPLKTLRPVPSAAGPGTGPTKRQRPFRRF